MKLTESMLRSFVTTSLSAGEIGSLLTMVGFELEEAVDVDGETVLDINIMANRGDGASVLGLSREVLAKDAGSHPTQLLKELVLSSRTSLSDQSTIPSSVTVEIQSPHCTRYACQVVTGLSNGPSPDWLQDRLQKIGQRPISLVVDLTNYVMLLTGQPLHAFDLDTLPAKKIVVRQALAGESVTTLDGVQRKLDAGQLMICDDSRPIAVAGVMGGADTEVSKSTTKILLESAHFDHQAVRKTRKQLGLQTEASYRFERYVDPEGVVRALDLFRFLLAETGVSFDAEQVNDSYLLKPIREPITLRPSRCIRLLGMPVQPVEMITYLKDLGNKVVLNDDHFIVTPPSWRIDLVREDDLVEEIGRIHGYEKIPEALPIGSTPVGGTHGADALIDKIREQLFRCGLNQTISHSLRDLHPLDAAGSRVTVRNPHSPEIAHLRNSNLPCLAEAASRNGGRDFQLFEIGRIFTPGRERRQLAILSSGQLDIPSWSSTVPASADCFSLKGTLESVFSVAERSLPLDSSLGSDPRFHPTRHALLGSIGVFGQIHPLVAEACGLPVDTVMAEIDLDTFFESVPRASTYRTVHRNPAARRDIAILVSKAVPFSAIDQAIREAKRDFLEKYWLFDVYDGKGIEDGFHSLAIALQFRKAGNFTDEEANQERDAIVSALEQVGAKLR